jgi:hypothetical protein
MAGMASIMALLEAPSADEERKGIKFAYTLSQALRNGAGDFEFLHATTQALGRMAQRTANVDFGKLCSLSVLFDCTISYLTMHSCPMSPQLNRKSPEHWNGCVRSDPIDGKE